jgi:DNA-binding transcriptional ArsR family regulator
MADIFDVIADGTRRDILQLLRERAAAGEHGTSVSHIVTELGVSQPTVSKHLKVLREAELVTVREEVSTATTACRRAAGRGRRLARPLPRRRSRSRVAARATLPDPRSRPPTWSGARRHPRSTRRDSVQALPG